MSARSRRPQEERSALAAARGGAEKGAYVRAMFSDIAPTYDLLNRLLSFNVDRRWRRRALDAMHWRDAPRGRYLDLCAGTQDVAAELTRHPAFDGMVVAADFAEPMLRAGQRKGDRLRIHAVAADALSLPLHDGACDGVIVAFGIRNVTDLGAAVREAHRVLRPGGRFVILEFSTPPSAPVRLAYHLYFHRLLPRLGAMVSGHASAYRYLPRSVQHFPEPADVAAALRRAGFRDVQWRALTFGVAALYVGVR